ncbi:hypothetical protein [Pararhizobium haloflavum]|uniref:hypothetical protein n=1 Tax=Pararhizobium haloflavum TaxID=2037914 RepID=UPI000C176E49|nr:hypothetical protein [Pararhizobium haloflavum]
MDDPKHNQPPLSDRLSIEYETLSDRITDILTRARDEVPQTIEDDEGNAKVGDFVRGFRGLIRECEDAKKEEKRPHLDANKTIEDFFKAMTERLMKAREVVEKRGDAYLNKKAAEERARREEAARIARDEADRRMREAQAAEESGREVAADIALAHATEADERARVAEEASFDKASDLARTRGPGGTSTLATKWDFEVQAIGDVPLDQLRAFFSQAEIEKAIRGFVRAGGRQLSGVRIFESTRASYR